MRIQRRRVAGTLAAAILLLLALAGCRAFEPETVIVNKAPETYLTGAPVEEGGGQFHFHLFWHGTDEDGRVERFVWALTDSTVQDEETDDDEEDERFNPAVNITTLDIAHWTTRTDTVFDFQINEGSITQRDMTFHIAAVDDRGDFDRTPARLYFLSNSLGRPRIRFYDSLARGEENRIADLDTVGFGQPFVISWDGVTPNIASFSDELLAERDTIAPFDDGLYGYKYRLPLDVPCDEVNEDCWQPRRFNVAEGRLRSYFGEVQSLEFANNAESFQPLDQRRLAQGVHVLLVNTIDVAGVEVPVDKQALNFVINYDPETYLLGQPQPHDVNHDGVVDAGEVLDFATDPFFTDDLNSYPYYTRELPDGTILQEPFGPGDRVPQRSVVTFKAVGWDDHRDVRLREIDNYDGSSTPREVEFQGKFDAVGFYRGGANSLFRFESQFSPTGSNWSDETRGVAADTISFTVGSFDYEFTMRAVDELDKRDFTPSVFDFKGNFRPEVQCVRVVQPGTPSVIYDGTCDASIDTFFIANNDDILGAHPDWIRLTSVEVGPAWVNPNANAVSFTDPFSDNFTLINGFYYTYELEIYAEDAEAERLFLPRTTPFGPTAGDPAERMLSCRYQITSSADSLSNVVRDGTGEDDLTQNTYTLAADGQQHAVTYDDNGVWNMQVRVFVPQILLLTNSETFLGFLQGGGGGFMSETEARRALELLTLQMGLTTADVVARDGTLEDYVAERCAYYFWDEVRVPELHDELCNGTLNEGFAGRLLEDDFCFQSEEFRKQYVLKIVTQLGEVYPPQP